jgi:hypothetical protein
VKEGFIDDVVIDHGICLTRWAGLALRPIIWVGYQEGNLGHHLAIVLIFLSLIPMFIGDSAHHLGISHHGTPEDIPHFISIGCFQKRDPALVLLAVLQIVVGLLGRLLLIFHSGAFLLLLARLTIGLATGLNLGTPPSLGASHHLDFLGMLV